MAIYGIVPKDGELFTIEAHHCDFAEGIIYLRDEDMNEIAAYDPDDYLYIVYQKEFTTEEVLEQIRTA